MDEKDILQKIIDKDGSCDWIEKHPSGSHYICSQCPMSKLVKRVNSNDYLGCWDALRISIDDTESEVDDKYKEQATRMLFDLISDEILGENIDE